MTSLTATHYTLPLPELVGDQTLIRALNGSVRVEHERGKVTITAPVSQLTPGAARELAAFLVARANAAETEPDPADVKALTVAINRIWETHDETAEEMARAILRAGYRPPEREH